VYDVYTCLLRMCAVSAHTHTPAHTPAHSNQHAHTHIYTHVHTHTHTYIHTHTHTHTNIHRATSAHAAPKASISVRAGNINGGGNSVAGKGGSWNLSAAHLKSKSPRGGCERVCLCLFSVGACVCVSLCMRVIVCVCVVVFVCEPSCLLIHTYIQTYATHISTHAHTHTHTQTHMYIYTYISICMCIYVYMYIYIYKCTSVYTYIDKYNRNTYVYINI